MLNALLWGGIAGSAVFLGSLIGILFNIKKYIIGIIMAFGTGILMGAASFELLLDSQERGGIVSTTFGFILGAIVFTIFNLIISKKGGKERKRSSKNPPNKSGLAIFIGTVIDAIPESIIIGVSLINNHSVSYILVIAIFISNFPEGLSSTIGLKKDNYSNFKILLLWFIVFLLSILSSLIGYTFLKDSSEVIISLIGSFAAGGIVAMVSSTMMPEAYEEGGPIIGLIAALGLITSLILTVID